MMKALLYGVAVLLTLISGTLAQQQQAVTASFGVLPFLPRPGEPFPEGHYVFQGPTAYDITVIYPERAPDGRIIGVRKQVRIPLGNRVQPDVECEVIRREDGKYVYRYAVTNGPNARDSIGRWSIRLPWEQGEAATSGRWKVSRLTRDVPSAAGAGAGGPALQVSLGHPDMLTWSLDPPIRAGEPVTGFTIVSPFAPGMTKAYASSGELAIPGDLPEEAREGIAKINVPDWREYSFLTIAPQYPAGFPKVGKAADFAYGFRVMASQGQLDPGSAFVTNTISLLSLFLESEGNVTISGSQLDGLERAAANKERQLARAMRLAFDAP